MRKTISFIIGILIIANNMHGQDITFLLMNQDITRIEFYSSGKLVMLNDYITEGSKIIVYSTDTRLMQTHINREYIFGDSVIEVNNYYPDGYNYFYSKFSYINGLIKVDEYNNFEMERSGKTEYFYDSNSNLIRSVYSIGGVEYEKKYSYFHGNLVLVEEFSLYNGRIRAERVDRINGKIVHTPSYDLYIKTDKKVIENKIDGDTKTTTVTYFLDDQIFELQKYYFQNNKIQNIVIDNRWRADVLERKFFWK